MPTIDRYVVAGNPVEHSQSPFIQTEFARQTGQPLSYGRQLWPLDGFDRSLGELIASGARGCNVTVPFKFEAARRADHLTPRAALAGAANVLAFEADGVHGDNTDGVGLVRDIEGNAGVVLRDKRVLLIGAGGAAAGVLGPLLSAGPAEVVVANRTLARALEVVDRHAAVTASVNVTAARLRATTLLDCGTGFDIVVNATASSLSGAAVPVAGTVLAPGALALDMMYGPAAQGFLAWARAQGARPRDGLGMLVEQAAEAFAWWRGVRPDTAPVLAVLRERMVTQPEGR